MVAYSFKARFAPPILIGLESGPMMPGMKRQTIRADRKRHARPGEELQLYTGMRTRSCRLLGKPVCASCLSISLKFGLSPVVLIGGMTSAETAAELDAFAAYDGFEDWADLRAFWASEHPGVTDFFGVLIRWEPRA